MLPSQLSRRIDQFLENEFVATLLGFACCLVILFLGLLAVGSTAMVAIKLLSLLQEFLFGPSGA